MSVVFSYNYINQNFNISGLVLNFLSQFTLFLWVSVHSVFMYPQYISHIVKSYFLKIGENIMGYVYLYFLHVG